jgi:glycosyltransferase involved in cell wall biosynthesis
MTKNYHVVHLTSAHPASDTRIFIKECRSLAKAGYTVTLVAQNAVSETIDGVHVVGIPFSGGRIKRMLFASRKVYKKALELQADLYHLHDPELLPYGIKLAKLGKKVIYDSHEDLPRQILTKHYIPSFLRSTVSRIMERREQSAVKQFAGVIAATPIIRHRFEKLHINCVDVCNYPSLDEIYTANIPFAEKKNEACYIGSITEIRGIREKVAAMHGASFTLNLAGAFSPAELGEEIRQHPGWKNIHYFGFANRTTVREILDSSKVGLVTLRPTQSFAEALPVKMFEYMAAGIPVVATDLPLWKSIIDEHNCGVTVDVYQTEKLRSVIEQLINNSALAEQMGKNGRAAVEQKFNWNIEEKKLILFYSSILADT